MRRSKKLWSISLGGMTTIVSKERRAAPNSVAIAEVGDRTPNLNSDSQTGHQAWEAISVRVALPDRRSVVQDHVQQRVTDFYFPLYSM
jgi:hypothetical protein